eukprot:1505050-Pleurochrysis_carterae.AAC.2
MEARLHVRVCAHSNRIQTAFKPHSNEHTLSSRLHSNRRARVPIQTSTRNHPSAAQRREPESSFSSQVATLQTREENGAVCIQK